MWSDRSVLASIFGATLTAGLFAAQALAAEVPYRVRGTLAAVDGAALTIATRDGETVNLALGEKTPVFTVTPAKLADLRRGQFVGVTSIESAGQMIGLEVHIFAEALRGLSEGHYPWDLVAQENMMTNADIAWIEEVGANRKIRLKYAVGEEKIDGAQTITIPPEAAVVNFLVGSRELLAAGAHIVAVVIKAEGGGVNPIAVIVGQGGSKPPM